MNFKNEIVWKRSHATHRNRYGANHDVLLFYTMSDTYTWNRVLQEYDEEYLEKHYRHVDQDGRRYSMEPKGAGISRGVTVACAE